MTAEMARPARRFNWSKVRWLIYLAIFLGIVAWKYVPRPWKPARTIETPHYIIASTASQAQTEQVGQVVELLYNAYSSRFGTLPTFRHEHPKLKLLLYLHVRLIKSALNGNVRNFYKTGQLPPDP